MGREEREGRRKGGEGSGGPMYCICLPKSLMPTRRVLRMVRLMVDMVAEAGRRVEEEGQGWF